MTATSPSTGLRMRTRRLIRRLSAAAIAAALATAPMQASATTDDGEDDPARTPIVTLQLGGAEVAERAPVSTNVVIRNDTGSTLSAGVVDLALNRTPLGDSAALDAWLDDGSAGGTFQTLVAKPTEPVGAASSSLLNMFATSAEVGALAPGVYPIRASLSDATTSDGTSDVTWSVSATAVVVVSAASPPEVGVFVPITATPADGSLLTAEELTGLTAPDGDLTAQLDGIDGTAAIVGVDPAIAASIRVLGQSAPETAVAWLERLESLSNTRFTLQFADADAAVQVHAGLRSPLAPPGLAGVIDPADFPPQTPTPAPTDTAEPEEQDEPVEPELPDDEELSAVRGAVPGVLWPRGDVTARDLASFADLFGDETVTILPSTSVSGSPGASASIDDRPVLITDTAASKRLSAAVQEADATTRSREAVAAAGHLFFAAKAAPGAPLLVGIDRADTRNAAALKAALSSVASSLTWSGLRAAPTPAVDAVAKADATRSTALTDVLADEQRLQTFSSILDDPLVLLTPERIRIMRLFGVGVDGPTFPALVAEHRETTQQTLNAVGIQRLSDIQLFSAAAPLPVWVRNDLPWPVSVTLYTQPSDPRLSVQDRTEVVATAASNTRVTIPVEARVASGELRVDFRLTSPTGVPIGSPATANVTLRADWEGIGLIVLSAVIVLLFGLGTVRTVLRRRRARDEADTDGADADEAEAVNGGMPDHAEPAEAGAEAADTGRGGRGAADTETSSASGSGRASEKESE